MSEKNPTLQDIWRLLGRMNGHFDDLERQMVAIEQRLGGRISAIEERLGARIGALEARVTAQVGALKESIEARDFRLDEHGRRLTHLKDTLL